MLGHQKFVTWQNICLIISAIEKKVRIRIDVFFFIQQIIERIWKTGHVITSFIQSWKYLFDTLSEVELFQVQFMAIHNIQWWVKNVKTLKLKADVIHEYYYYRAQT